MAEGLRLPKRKRGKWSDAETSALIEAWKPLYKRRRNGEVDPWVPARQHDRVRSSRCLVAVDWRAVAAAMNASRGNEYHRTHDQCMTRVATLTTMYLKEKALSGAAPSSWRFFTDLHEVLSVSPPGQTTVQEEGGGVVVGAGTGGDASAVAVGDPAQPADDPPHVAVQEGGGGNAAAVQQVDEHRFVKREIRRSEEPEPQDIGERSDTTAVDARGPLNGARRGEAARFVADSRVPTRPRSVGSASRVAGMRGGACAAGFAASVADLLGVVQAAGGSPSVSAAAEVVMKVTDMCQKVAVMCENVMMKSLDVERDASNGRSGTSRHP